MCIRDRLYTLPDTNTLPVAKVYQGDNLQVIQQDWNSGWTIVYYRGNYLFIQNVYVKWKLILPETVIVGFWQDFLCLLVDYSCTITLKRKQNSAFGSVNGKIRFDTVTFTVWCSKFLCSVVLIISMTTYFTRTIFVGSNGKCNMGIFFPISIRGFVGIDYVTSINFGIRDLRNPTFTW